VVWNTYLARTLASDLDQLGIFMFIMTQYAMFTILAEGNISYTFQHFIAKESTDLTESGRKYWTFSFISKLIFGLFFGVILFFVIINQYPNQVISAFLISSALIIFNVGAAPLGILIAHNEFKLQISTYLINSISFTLGAILVISYTKNINYILFVLFISNLIAAVYSMSNGFKVFGSFIWSINFRQLFSKLLKFSLPLLIASFCFTLFFRMDVNIIATNMSAIYVSYISMGLMFYFLIGDLLWSQLASAMTPELLRKWNDGQESRNSVINSFLGLLSLYSIVTSLMCISLKFMGEWIFNFALGKSGDFINVLPILYFLILGLPYLVIYAFFYRIYLLNNSSFKFMVYSLLCVVVKFILIYLLVNYISYKVIVLLSGGIMAFVSLIFILGMKELKGYKNILLIMYLKISVITITLFYFNIIFPKYVLTYEIGIFSFFICLISILFFKKTLLVEYKKIIL
jgi:O-antigen/teichoic acid export membrane protein